jgi:hypothetical protein
MLEVMSEYPWLLPAIFLLIGVSAVFILSRLRNDKTTKDSEAPKAIELIDKFYLGKYLGGFSGADEIAPLVFCAVTEDCFVFTMGTHGEELGRIPRDSINQIIVDDKTSIKKHLVSKHSVSVEKAIHHVSDRGKGYSLVIDWDDAHGERSNTVFVFEDKQCEVSAEQAQEKLKKWIKARVLDMPIRHAYNQ